VICDGPDDDAVVVKAKRSTAMIKKKKIGVLRVTATGTARTLRPTTRNRGNLHHIDELMTTTKNERERERVIK
jgi:hypothetical protein